MSGIVSYGAYIPFNRIQRSTIAAALESRAGKGERAVASYDEDTVTMAVEAARGCINGTPKDGISTLYFATTNPPYQEKLNSATIHAALEMNPATRALDLGGSVRSGFATLLTAAEAANGTLGLATMSDIRLGAPEGAAEQSGGDAAVAFLVGSENVMAEIKQTYSETLEHEALWRLPGEKFPKVWEERFALSQIFIPLLTRAAAALLEQAGIQASDLASVVIDSPNPRAVTAVAKGLKLKPEQVADAFLETVGHSGAAHAGMMLAAALDVAKPGDRIMVLSVSDGVDGAIIKATDAIEPGRGHIPVRSLVDSKRNDLSYTRFLKWRDILPTERPRRPDPARPAGPPAFRNRHWKFGFVGSECKSCSTKHLPPQRVCVKCGGQEMQPVSFDDRKASIVTYALDRLAYTLQPPMVMAMLDFDGGGRVELEVTDCEPDKVDIGDELEMTFRRFYTADGVHNYFWKARPIR